MKKVNLKPSKLYTTVKAYPESGVVRKVDHRSLNLLYCVTSLPKGVLMQYVCTKHINKVNGKLSYKGKRMVTVSEPAKDLMGSKRNTTFAIFRILYGVREHYIALSNVSWVRGAHFTFDIESFMERKRIWEHYEYLESLELKISQLNVELRNFTDLHTQLSAINIEGLKCK